MQYSAIVSTHAMMTTPASACFKFRMKTTVIGIDMLKNECMEVVKINS